MTKTTTVLSAAMVAGAVACGSHTGPVQPAGPALDEEFTLAVGQTASVTATRLVVRFLALVGDSRCPSDALILCAWEGDGVVTVRVAEGTEPADLELHTNEGFATSAAYRDYTIRLIDLAPYPATIAPIPTDTYRLTLTVSRRW